MTATREQILAGELSSTQVIRANDHDVAGSMHHDECRTPSGQLLEFGKRYRIEWRVLPGRRLPRMVVVSEALDGEA